MATVTFNRINIENKAQRNLRKKSYVNLASRNAQIKFQSAKRNAIEAFDGHPVTQEILDEKGHSRILSRANLFSLLGFSEGANVIAHLKEIIFSEVNMRMNLTPRFTKENGNLVYEFKVRSPSMEKIYDETRNEDGIAAWTSESWVKLIEEGIPHFGGILYSKTLFSDKEFSRSRQAIQRKGVSDEGTIPVQYISKILNDFLSHFNTI